MCLWHYWSSMIPDCLGIEIAIYHTLTEHSSIAVESLIQLLLICKEQCLVQISIIINTEGQELSLAMAVCYRRPGVIYHWPRLFVCFNVRPPIRALCADIKKWPTHLKYSFQIRRVIFVPQMFNRHYSKSMNFDPKLITGNHKYQYRRPGILSLANADDRKYRRPGIICHWPWLYTDWFVFNVLPQNLLVFHSFFIRTEETNVNVLILGCVPHTAN